eukprot:g74154.t1
MKNRQIKLMNLLGIRLPIIQAPMAGCQGAELAAAVSNAKALGSLPCALLDLNTLSQELQVLHSRTSPRRLPYNVNFFAHSPPPPAEAEWRLQAWIQQLVQKGYYQEFGVTPPSSAGPVPPPFGPDALSIIQQYKPRVVSFHFGLPAPELVEAIKSWGARILSTATTVEEAMWLEEHGADAIIAQGLEAGGHRGSFFLSHDLDSQMGTMALVPQVCQAVQVPVIAAGGVANAEGVEAALRLGASGVQVGTSFLLCVESRTSRVHRAALTRRPLTGDTVLTNCFTGRVARGIKNRLTSELGPLHPAAPPFPYGQSALRELRASAENKGLDSFTSLWAGQNRTGCKVVSGADMVEALSNFPSRADLGRT